jgi:hypothetical protein
LQKKEVPCDMGGESQGSDYFSTPLCLWFIDPSLLSIITLCCYLAKDINVTVFCQIAPPDDFTLRHLLNVQECPVASQHDQKLIFYLQNNRCRACSIL